MKSMKLKISACLIAFTALALSTANETPARHAYRVTVRVDTQALHAAGVIERMDPNAWGIANNGNLSILITDTASGQQLAKVSSDSGSPKFSHSAVYESDRDFMNVEVKLRDRDYLWINPASWGFVEKAKLSDDETSIATIGIEPAQTMAIDTLAYSENNVTRIVSNSNSEIVMNRSESDGKIIETRELTSITEYQNIVRTINSIAYSIEITRLR